METLLIKLITPQLIYSLGVGGGFVLTLLISSYWSSIYGNEIHHFLTYLSIFFLSSGWGSSLGEKERQKDTHIWPIWVLFLIMGLSLPFLEWSIHQFGRIAFLPLPIITSTGFFSGFFLSRIRQSSEKVPLFFIEYLSPFVLSVAYLFIFFVFFRHEKLSLFISVLSLTTLAIFHIITKAYSKCILVLISIAFIAKCHQAIEKKILNSGSRLGTMVTNQMTSIQRMTLIEQKPGAESQLGLPEHTLYYDGFVRFSSTDEQSFHSCFINVPAMAQEYFKGKMEKLLLIGGGEGLSLRNLLQLPKPKSITVIERDPHVFEFSQKEPKLRMYHLDSLKDPRVHIIVEEPYQWIKKNKNEYEIIFVDFPLPKNLSLSRFYTIEFLSLVLKRLTPTGLLIIQAGPHDSIEKKNELSEMVVSIYSTLLGLSLKPIVYRSLQEGTAFVMAYKSNRVNLEEFFNTLSKMNLKKKLIRCSPTQKEIIVPSQTHSLSNPVLVKNTLNWFDVAGKPFFDYQGERSIFLPD